MVVIRYLLQTVTIPAIMPISAVVICCCKKAASFSGNGDISRYVAEAKFFRAYSYFDLVQLFGDVIITKEPLDITSPRIAHEP